MLWRWIAVLGVVSSVWLGGTQVQPQDQARTPAATNSTQSEITTLGMDAPIKVQANLVLVRVVVRDAAGNVVSGLKQEDFQVFDNGNKQRISAFNIETAETPGASGTTTVEGKTTETDGQQARPELPW